MPSLLIIGLGVGFLVFLAFLLFIVRPKTQTRRLQNIVNAAGLPLTPEIEPIVVADQKREVRSGFIGIAIGVVVAAVGMLLAGVTVAGEMFLIYFTSIVAFSGIALAISTVTRENRRQSAEVRFARLRAVTIADYRSPLDRWTPRVIVVLALGAFALRVALTPGTFGVAAAFLYLYALAMVVSLTISEIAGRLLLTRGQPAGSALELAWDDALRSRALAALSVGPFYLAMYFGIAGVALYPSSGSAAAALGVQVESVVTILGAVLLLVSVISSASHRSQQRYLLRLWPELARAQSSGPSVAGTARS